MTLRRIDATVPGPTGYHYYGDHEYEHLLVWWPMGSSFQNSPVVVFVHGGLGFNPGNRALEPNASRGGIAGRLFGLGWPVVSVEFAPVASNADPRLEPATTRLWPGPELSLARAIQYIKSKASDPELWGPGNSIDPNQVVGLGMSYGSTMLLELALSPAPLFPAAGPLAHDLSPFPSELDHRPRVVIVNNGQLDWTQFAFDPLASNPVYKSNVHQVFMHRGQGLVFGPTVSDPVPPNALPMRIKRRSSPWWILQAWGAEVTDVAVYLHFGTSTAPKVANLGPADWSPGTPRLDEVAGKAFYDPHHHFQCQPFADSLTAFGILNRAVWGNNQVNPGGLNNVNVPSIPNDVADWLTGTVGIG